MSNSAVRCRTISQHLNDLKKENFSLKLRIYFLEEKIQQKFEQSEDDVHKRVSELSSCTAHMLCVSVCHERVKAASREQAGRTAKS